MILDKWKIDFNTYMSSGLSYVVMEVDGSGSGGNVKTLKNTKFYTIFCPYFLCTTLLKNNILYFLLQDKVKPWKPV